MNRWDDAERDVLGTAADAERPGADGQYEAIGPRNGWSGLHNVLLLISLQFSYMGVAHDCNPQNVRGGSQPFQWGDQPIFDLVGNPYRMSCPTAFTWWFYPSVDSSPFRLQCKRKTLFLCAEEKRSADESKQSERKEDACENST